MSEEKEVGQKPEEESPDFVVEPLSDNELEDVNGGLAEIAKDGGCAGGSGCSDGFC